MKKIQFKDYYRPQEYVEKPRFTSIDQIKASNDEYCRLRGNLSKNTIDINIDRQ